MLVCWLTVVVSNRASRGSCRNNLTRPDPNRPDPWHLKTSWADPISRARFRIPPDSTRVDPRHFKASWPVNTRWLLWLWIPLRRGLIAGVLVVAVCVAVACWCLTDSFVCTTSDSGVMFAFWYVERYTYVYWSVAAASRAKKILLVCVDRELFIPLTDHDMDYIFVYIIYVI